MSRQIGEFLFFIGLTALVIFFATWGLKHPAWSFCFWGLFPFATGVYLMLKNPHPPPSASARFRMLRKIRKTDKEDGSMGKG